MYRTHRRTVDHLMSLVEPVRRYHCMALECAVGRQISRATRFRAGVT